MILAAQNFKWREMLKGGGDEEVEETKRGKEENSFAKENSPLWQTEGDSQREESGRKRKR